MCNTFHLFNFTHFKIYTIPSREFLLHVSLYLQAVFISRDLSHSLNSLADFFMLHRFFEIIRVFRHLSFRNLYLFCIINYLSEILQSCFCDYGLYVVPCVCMYNVYIFPKFGKHIICSWKNNFQKINMFIQLEVYISIQEFSLFGGEQSFSVYTKQ